MTRGSCYQVHGDHSQLYSDLLQESQQEERETTNAEERMLAQLRMSNINHLELIEDKYRVREKIQKVGKKTNQVIKLTLLLFFLVGETFWVQTIIRSEAP